MNKENPVKYSLQLATYEAIEMYSIENDISFRQATFIIFTHLKNKKQKQLISGFNLKSPMQFYSSLKRFRSLKMQDNATQ